MIHKVTEVFGPDVETVTDAYARRFSGEVGRLILERQQRGLCQVLDRYQAGSLRVLDVGGGHAQLTSAILAYGHHVTVQGSCSASCARLEKLALLGERVEFIVEPFDQLGASGRRYDVVTSFRMMAHMEDWRSFLKRLASLAEQELIIDFASPWSINALSKVLFPLKLKIEGNTRPFYCQSPGEVVAALEAEGFEVTGIYKQFTLPLALHRGLASRIFTKSTEKILESVGITRLLGSPVILSARRKASR